MDKLNQLTELEDVQNIEVIYVVSKNDTLECLYEKEQIEIDPWHTNQ